MEIKVKNRIYKLPIFMPDATHASIKGLDLKSLEATGNTGIVTNTYHLLSDDIVPNIKALGGFKKFTGYNGLVVTDSGGFQAMSLARKNTALGKITDNGILFKNPKSGRWLELTPEKCIETQVALGSDIIMVLDDCTDPQENYDIQAKSVNRTVSWAKRCKQAYEHLTDDISIDSRPLIFAIVQGGNNKDLRKKCADELISIGFDGYAYGGWPMQHGKLMQEILEFTAKITPNTLPKYAMGVGKPNDIIECYKMGYNMFDCVIPTRDARHGRLYAYQDTTIREINIGNSAFTLDETSIDPNCTCYTCKHYSKAYLRYLFKTAENSFSALATIHNLTVYNKIIALL